MLDADELSPQPGMMGMDGGYGAYQHEGAYGGMPQAVPSMAPQVAMPPTATHVPGGGSGAPGWHSVDVCEVENLWFP